MIRVWFGPDAIESQLMTYGNGDSRKCATAWERPAARELLGGR